MKENALIEKSLVFAARIMKLHQFLIKEKNESIIAKQIYRSATSIGANINEANYGISKADFIPKMQIALKETAETEYWLRLLIISGNLEDRLGESLLADCLEIKRMLVSSLKTAKSNNLPSSK
jgi:four helix bundle protein